jgi:hypothetical protein
MDGSDLEASLEWEGESERGPAGAGVRGEESGVGSFDASWGECF